MQYLALTQENLEIARKEATEIIHSSLQIDKSKETYNVYIQCFDNGYALEVEIDDYQNGSHCNANVIGIMRLSDKELAAIKANA